MEWLALLIINFIASCTRYYFMTVSLLLYRGWSEKSIL
jgi:hypothetical protein